MDWKERLKRLEEWSNRFLTLWGFLTAVAGATVTGAFGINGDFPPFLFFGFSLLVFTTTLIAIGLPATVRQRFVRIGGVWLIIALGFGYALRVQNKAEAAKNREAAIQAKSYKLRFVGVESGLLPVTADRSLAAGLVAGLRLENSNPFPLFMIVDRRHTATEGASSDAPIEPDQQPLEIRANSNFIINGENVQFVRPLSRAQVAGGSVDFQFCYGRDKDSLNKGMLVQVDFQVRFDEMTGVMTTNSPPIVKDFSCG